MYSAQPTPSNPFCIRHVKSNILFEIKVTGYAPGYRELSITKTCRDFINLITGSQTYIDLLEDTAVRNNCTLSIAGVEEFKPEVIYNRHDLYDSDIYTHKPHAKSPLHIRMNITNFILFRREIEEFYMPGGLKPQYSIKPQRSIMPSPAELLEFLNEGEQTQLG